MTTLYALLVLAMFDEVDAIDLNKMATFIASHQKEDGSFKGDYAGEVDTRFSYSALSALKLLNKLDLIDRGKARTLMDHLEEYLELRAMLLILSAQLEH